MEGDGKSPRGAAPRKAGKAEKAEKACGGNNSPRAPLFLPPGFAGSAGRGEREDYARSQERGGGSAVGRPFFDALGPRATSGARPTAGAQPEFTSGVKRSRRRASSADRTACPTQTGLRSRWDAARSEIIPPAPPCFCLPASPVRQDRVNGKIMPEAKGEGGSSVGRPFFDALGPRATSGARPTAGAQPEFTSGVKRSRRRASSADRTACLAQTGLCGSSGACKVRNNSPRAPLFLPPGFAGSAGRGEREDYARSQERGGGVQSEGRFSTLWGPGRRQEPGRRQARSRNSFPALSAAAVVQAPQIVQRVRRRRDCAVVGTLQGQK